MTRSDAKPVLARRLDALADNPTLDRGVSALRAITERLPKSEQDASPTGSPIHPALVHFPIGGAFSAAVVDAAGLDTAATVLTAFTGLAALPTALTGLLSFAGEESQRGRRVAFAHASSAATGTTLTLASLAARAAGADRAARLLLWGGCGAYGLAGLLGGHLVYGLNQDADETADAEVGSDT